MDEDSSAIGVVSWEISSAESVVRASVNTIQVFIINIVNGAQKNKNVSRKKKRN